jgi:hypothetical protein
MQTRKTVRVKDVSADASRIAKIQAGRREEFGDLLSLAVEQVRKMRILEGRGAEGEATYRIRIPRRYFPKDSIEELAPAIELARSLEGHLGRLSDRTICWFEFEGRHAGDLSLAMVEKGLQDFLANAERSLKRLSELQKLMLDLERHDKSPRPEEVAAMMMYEAAVRCGGRLSTNKNSVDGGNPGTFRPYLDLCQKLMPPEIRFCDLPIGGLSRLKKKADRIISGLTYSPS